MSTETFTVTTISGQSREIPANLVDDVVGLDAEGRIVVDHFGALDAPKDGAFLFGLTACCNASDKGIEDGVVCRGCYSYDETGSYLFAVLSGAGDWSYPEFDPISADARPAASPRFEARRSESHNWWVIWDRQTETWNEGIHGDAEYADGVPMWKSAARAHEVAAEMNAEQTTFNRPTEES